MFGVCKIETIQFIQNICSGFRYDHVTTSKYCKEDHLKIWDRCEIGCKKGSTGCSAASNHHSSNDSILVIATECLPTGLWKGLDGDCQNVCPKLTKHDKQIITWLYSPYCQISERFKLFVAVKVSLKEDVRLVVSLGIYSNMMISC